MYGGKIAHRLNYTLAPAPPPFLVTDAYFCRELYEISRLGVLEACGRTALQGQRSTWSPGEDVAFIPLLKSFCVRYVKQYPPALA